MGSPVQQGFGLTPNSTTTPYCSAAQFQNYCDVVFEGLLVNDDGSLTGPTGLLTSPRLAAALLAASGLVEAAVTAGNRAGPLDLNALAASGTAGGNYLAWLVAMHAAAMLMARRSDPTHAFPPALEMAMTKLREIREGVDVLTFLESQGSENIEYTQISEQDMQMKGLMTRYLYRVFGTDPSTLPWAGP